MSFNVTKKPKIPNEQNTMGGEFWPIDATLECHERERAYSNLWLKSYETRLISLVSVVKDGINHFREIY